MVTRENSRIDNPLADHIFDVEYIVRGVLRRALGNDFAWKKRLSGFVIGGAGRNRDDLAFRIPQSRELAAKYAACIDVHGIVQPHRLGYRRMPVDHERFTAIVRGPVVANGETKLVCFPSCLAIQRKVANFSEPRPCIDSFIPAWATTSLPSSKT